MTGFNSKRDSAANKLQEPYDQTALELCNVCGWKTLIPDDCCLNCERAQPAQELVREALENPNAAFRAKERLIRIMGTFDLATGHADTFDELLDSLESELRDVLGHYRAAVKEHLAQPAQEPVAHVYLFDQDGRPLIAWDNAKGIKIGDKLYTPPPQREWIWLSDADIAEVVDTTCQYSGGYEEYLIKKAERKIKELNT